MTSLIDVIFLLLLFFMLTSTFSRFAEVELMSGGGQSPSADVAPIFLQLRADGLLMNGRDVALADIADRLAARAEPETRLLIALRGDVSSQRLIDLLAVLRGVPELRITVLGAS
jgi:biopolymer transport protein ExbD